MPDKQSLSNLISCVNSINFHKKKFDHHCHLYNLLLQSLDGMLIKLHESGNLNISIRLEQGEIRLYNFDKQIYLTQSGDDFQI